MAWTRRGGGYRCLKRRSASTDINDLLPGYHLLPDPQVCVARHTVTSSHAHTSSAYMDAHDEEAAATKETVLALSSRDLVSSLAPLLEEASSARPGLYSCSNRPICSLFQQSHPSRPQTLRRLQLCTACLRGAPRRSSPTRWLVGREQPAIRCVRMALSSTAMACMLAKLGAWQAGKPVAGVNPS